MTKYAECIPTGSEVYGNGVLIYALRDLRRCEESTAAQNLVDSSHWLG